MRDIKLKQFSWIKKNLDEELYSTIRESFEYSDDFCKILASRGFENVEEVKLFLGIDDVGLGIDGVGTGLDLSCVEHGTGQALSLRKNEQLQKATEKIFETIQNDKWIVIHGDYDVDGISATSILFDFLYYQLNYKKVIPYIPSRLDEGYGISEGSLESILEIVKIAIERKPPRSPLSGGRQSSIVSKPPLGLPPDKGDRGGLPLIISVDCGVKETSLIDDKWYKVFDFIITDHHSLKIENNEVQLSKKAVAIIHPQVEGSGFEMKEVCGTVVVYRLIEFVCTKLDSVQSDTPLPPSTPIVIPRGIGVKGEQLNEGNHKQRLPLNPSLGIPLGDSDNYLIGIEGLPVGKTGVGGVLMSYFPFLALATNCDVMPLVGKNREIMKQGLESFKRQVNLGLNSLIEITGIEKDKITPYHLGYILGPHINAAGRIGNALDAVKLFVSKDPELCKDLSQKLSALNITRQKITLDRMIIAERDALSQVEKGNKILVIVGESWEDGIIGLIAGKLCEKYHLPTIVISKGEDEAVGSCRSLANINITEILAEHSDLLLRFGGHTQAAGLRLKLANVEKFKSKITKYCNKTLSDADLKKSISIDLDISENSICEEFLEELAQLEPHGMGNPKPNFLFSNFTVENCSPLGKDSKHVKIHISKGNIDINAVGFNVEKKMFELEAGDKIDIVGSLEMNEYNGKSSLQIILKDVECL